MVSKSVIVPCLSLDLRSVNQSQNMFYLLCIIHHSHTQRKFSQTWKYFFFFFFFTEKTFMSSWTNYHSQLTLIYVGKTNCHLTSCDHHYKWFCCNWVTVSDLQFFLRGLSISLPRVNKHCQSDAELKQSIPMFWFSAIGDFCLLCNTWQCLKIFLDVTLGRGI